MGTADEEGWRTGDRAREARGRRPEMRMVSRVLPRFIAAHRDAGRDSRPLLAPFGLPDDTAQRSELDTPLEALRSIPEQVAADLERPNLGLELASSIPPIAFGLVELGTRTSPTLREGLERFVRYSALLNAAESFELVVQGDFAELNHRIPGTRRALGRQCNELQVAWWVRLIRECVSQPWSPGEVCFAHAAPADPAPLTRFFAARPLHFAMGLNALRFPATSLALPLTSSDPALLALFDDRAERQMGRGGPEELLVRLRELIRDELRDGRPTLQSVASRIGASPRTLQRRLDAHNTTFNDLLEEVRLTLAKEYLANPRFSAKEIAYLLGYSDLTTFIRAFKRATGSTPVDYRNRK